MPFPIIQNKIQYFHYLPSKLKNQPGVARLFPDFASDFEDNNTVQETIIHVHVTGF